MAFATERSPHVEPRDRIRSVCGPCRELLHKTLECNLLRRGGRWFMEVFEAKRCRPREFVEMFLKRRLAARVSREHLEHVRDIASEVVLDLTQRPPRTFPSYDLLGLRRILAGRAHRIQIDYWRKVTGRIRCGNCTHHRLASERGRICAHPDPRHPWTGRPVRASLDPRTFDPPCECYSSRREGVRDQLEGQDLLTRIPDPSSDPETTAAKKERGAILIDCIAAVQRDEPRVSFVLTMFFLRGKTNEEIARALDTTVRTVTRYKDRGLRLLREEFESRGIDVMPDLG